MDKNGKKVVRIIAIIFISFILFILYMARPIFGIFLCDFDKYEYRFIKENKENSDDLYFDYDEKIKSIIINVNKETAKNTDLLRIEIYENDKPNLSETYEEEKEYEKNDILKEKIEINKKIEEFKSKFIFNSKKRRYLISKLPKIKSGSEFKIVLYYKNNSGEHRIDVRYKYEEDNSFPCMWYAPIG